MKWENVKDELCTCGHLKSEHMDAPELVRLGVTGGGDGPCPKCKCIKFTWKKFIMRK